MMPPPRHVGVSNAGFEPFLGLSPIRSRRLQKLAPASLLRSLRDEGITILRIECSMDVVMNLLDHTVVRDFGSKLTGGAPEAIRAHTRVRDTDLVWLV